MDERSEPAKYGGLVVLDALDKLHVADVPEAVDESRSAGFAQDMKSANRKSMMRC